MFSSISIKTHHHLTRCVNMGRINFSSYNKSTLGRVVEKLPKFQEKNEHSSTGLYLGAGIMALGAVYFLRSNADVTREYAGTNPYYGEKLVRDRVRKTYGYVLGGLTLTGVSAVGMFKAGLPNLIARMNPWLFLGLSWATSIPLLIATQVTDYNSDPIPKHVLWAGFNVSMAGVLSTLGILGGPLISQAMLGTGCIVGGLSLVASKAKPGSFEQYEGALGIGLGIVVAAGLGGMIFPMPLLHSVSLYGGLAVFSGLTLTETQQLLRHAETSSVYDPVNESLNIYLITVNNFIRVAEILSNMENRKREKGK